MIHRNEIGIFIMAKKSATKDVYPTELVAKAKYEMRIFERVASDTGEELILEVIRLRAENAKLMADFIEATK